ncbi:hypothetical protein RJ639_000801 [Escallonia herrerae]|uniref:Reverse transcriptase Ty1/copia-type domain-containing protein n=1 Tax=Escallonia herrerae TaxID=1293975 RepID=A0AA88XHC7_9ASTE|nr:hypothetical protein RJ639_000801 [Escallonia herrerae]
MGYVFETGVYEEQMKSGYRFSLHPFALRFFEHYCMAPGQLVPNGWRKLASLIYLVQTSGYKPDATDFMRVFFETVSSKELATARDGITFIGGPKSNKGWHSRYFFFGRLDKGELPFDRDWNPFCKDFENPGKPTPNNQTKHILSHIKFRGGLCINEPLLDKQLEWAKIIPPRPIPAGLLILSPPRAIPSMTSAETVPLEMASGSEKSPQGGFLGVLQKAKGKRKEKKPSAELPPIPKRTRFTPSERSPRILEQVSMDDDPIFRPRWTLRCDDLGMPDSQVSEQHLHGILPRDKEVFQTQTHETFACSFAQVVYTMYASGSEMLSRFEMARQVAADKAQQKREAVKEAQEASHRAEELSKQEADHLAQIATLEKRLERVKRKAAEEVTKARDQGIRDFLDGNTGDEWLKKQTDDGLEINELGFAKAKEMFAERFPAYLWSIATITNCRCPDAMGKGPSRSIPHTAKGMGETIEVKGETAFSRRAFTLPEGHLFTENANLDVGRRPRRNAVYFTDSSKLSISKVAALNRPESMPKARTTFQESRSRERDSGALFLWVDLRGVSAPTTSSGEELGFNVSSMSSTSERAPSAQSKEGETSSMEDKDLFLREPSMLVKTSPLQTKSTPEVELISRGDFEAKPIELFPNLFRETIQANKPYTYNSTKGGVKALIVYVDDIIVTQNDSDEKKALRNYLAKEFKIQDLGKLKYFLGIEVARSKEGILVSQQKYVLDMLEETAKLGCRPSDTSIEPNHRLAEFMEGEPTDKGMFQ